MDRAERPTDPDRRGKEGSKGGIKKEPNAQVLQGGFEVSNGHTEIGIPNTKPQPRKK